jgi:fido (protein-threonine AMPylation protein)
MNLRERDAQEMRNGVEVMEWIEHLTAHPDVPLDLDLVCHFNRLILQFTERDTWAGRVRAVVDWQTPDEWSRPRAIVSPEMPGLAVADIETGELLTHFPPDGEVGALLDELLRWIHSDDAQNFTPIERAAIFHHEFTRIHPFRDGNGRTARALMTLMLCREGFEYEVLILQKLLDERRNAYIHALRTADNGDLTEWILFFAHALRDALYASEQLD